MADEAHAQRQPGVREEEFCERPLRACSPKRSEAWETSLALADKGIPLPPPHRRPGPPAGLPETTDMRLRTTLSLALVVATLAPGAAAGPLQQPPQPPQNPTTPEKAVLGKILFWDEQLSSDGSMACGTCHMPGVGGGDPRIAASPAHPGPDGIFGNADDVFGSPAVVRADDTGSFVPDATFGFDHQATGRNSPSMIAAAYFPQLFWDGRANGTFTDPLTGNVIIPAGGALESQSLEPILSDIEMADEGRGWDAVVERLENAKPLALATNLPLDVDLAIFIHQTYPALFTDAFGSPDITPVRIAFALAAYQRTLVPDQSKFDRVMRGQATFTQAENRGRGRFQQPGEPLQPVPRRDAVLRRRVPQPRPPAGSGGSGRRLVTGNFGDRGRFKTPSLRNVALRQRFFHTGAPGISNLLDLLLFYDQDGGPFADNKSPILNGLNVPPPPRQDIIAFLNTLTDPRVAAETAPFDRPTLWSERAQPNPLPLGTGGVIGSGFFFPRTLVPSPAHSGNEGFRIGVSGGLGGAWATLYVRVINLPGGAPARSCAPDRPDGAALGQRPRPGPRHLRRPAQRRPGPRGADLRRPVADPRPLRARGRVEVGHGADHGRVTAARE